MGRTGRQRGLTLIEVAIALAIMGLLAVLSVVSINAVTHSELRSTAIRLSGAIRHSYDLAIMRHRTQRIAIDLDKGVFWLDFTESPFHLGAERLEGESGGSADEGGAVKARDFDFSDEDDPEVKIALLAGAAAKFTKDETLGDPVQLDGDLKFSRVWTGHQEEAFREGSAFLHFFPAGFTEPALIELTDGDAFITLEVSPLTGKVRMHHEEMKVPDIQEDDRESSGDDW